MPFVGNAVVKQITDGLIRITGLSIDAGSPEGTIGLAENTGAPQVVLPAAFKPRDYDYPDVAGVVTLQDSVQCWWVLTSTETAMPPISVVKTGTTPEDFLISLDMGGLLPDPPLPPPNSGLIEIYVRFH